MPASGAPLSEKLRAKARALAFAVGTRVRRAAYLAKSPGAALAPQPSGTTMGLNANVDFSRVRFADDSAKARRHFTIGPWMAVTELHFGGYMVYDTRNVDTTPGPIREGWAEPWNDIMLRALLRDGDVCVNVGANYGYFTLLAGILVGDRGKVFSFEANPSIFAHLMRSLFFSGTINRTSLFNRAVSDKDGDSVEFMFDPQFSGGGACAWQGDIGSIVPRELEQCVWSEKTVPELLDEHGMWRVGQVGLFSTFQATTITLDTALRGKADRIDLLLMDIEGSEPYAILGATEMLRKSPNPRVILEWAGHYNDRPWLGDRCRRMWDFLTGELKLKAFHIRPTTRNAYLFPPDLLHVPDFASFCQLPHGEVFFTRV